MAKVTEEKISYHQGETGLVGSTKTYVTINDMKYGDSYDYPALKLSDLTAEARDHLVRYFPSTEAAESALEFGPRNRLAGYVASRIRTALVAPSTNMIRTRLQELACKWMVAGRTDEAAELAVSVKDADTRGLQSLWEVHLKKSDSST
jgi:hypothetical protein